MRNSTFTVVLVFVALAAIASVQFGRLRDGHSWGDDFALYILHARNLVQGRPYADTGYLYNRFSPEVGPPTYPPVGPALLAPVYAWCGLDFVAMKVVMLASLVASLGILAFAVRRDLPRSHLVILLLLVGLNHSFFRFVNAVGSDLPFLAFAYLALVLMETPDRVRGWTRSTARGMAMGLAVYLAYGVRSIGLVLVPTVIVYDVWSSRRIRWPTLAGLAVFGAMAAGQNFLLHSDSRYFDQISSDADIVLRNAATYGGRLAAFWSNGYSKPAAAAMAALVLLLGAVGYACRLLDRKTPAEVFTPLYAAAVLVWPANGGERLLLPILPLWLFYALRGLNCSWPARRAGVRRAALTLLCAAGALSYAGHYAFGSHDSEEGIHHPRAAAMFAFVSSHTSPSDVIVFIKPRALALMTNRRASVYHAPKDDARLWDYFRSIGATYVVVVNRDSAFDRTATAELLTFLRGFVARYPGQFREIYRNDDFTVCRLTRVWRSSPAPSQ